MGKNSLFYELQNLEGMHHPMSKGSYFNTKKRLDILFSLVLFIHIAIIYSLSILELLESSKYLIVTT